jgi:hypothetical protein
VSVSCGVGVGVHRALGRGRRERPWGPESLPLSDLAPEVYLLRALGPACVGPEGGGPEHPPDCGVGPERGEEAP